MAFGIKDTGSGKEKGQDSGIKWTSLVAGPYNVYDIITLAKTENLSEIGAIALNIKSLPGVYGCVTCVTTAIGNVHFDGRGNICAVMRG